MIKRKSFISAPAILNTSDAAMWITGWNEAVDALEAEQAQADDMAQSMVDHMRELTKQKIKGLTMEKSEYKRESDGRRKATRHMAQG